MKILIYISKETDSVDINHKFVSTLSRCLEPLAEVHVTSRLSSPITDYSVVHILGAWQYSGARLLQKAMNHCIPTVFSPLGGLEPWIMKRHCATKKLMSVGYQRKMAESASAVHLCNKMESDSFDKLNWNKRAQVVTNSVITNQIADEVMAKQMMRLYQKVIDSNCYSQIGEDVEDAIGYLLLAGIDTAEAKDTSFRQKATACLDHMEGDDWRHIYLYASDEGILERIIHGIGVLKYDAPRVDVSVIDRFPVVHPVLKTPIVKDKILSKNILLLSKVEDIESAKHQCEKDICTMIINIKYEVNQRDMSMLHLSELYEIIKFNNYDEDRLADMLKRVGIYKFASRLIFILQDVIGLTEGFMPIEGKDDKSTDELRRIITKLKE